jgi:hypothetical protein
MNPIRQKIFNTYPGAEDELLFLEDKFDVAIIGVVHGQAGLFAVCYSEPKVLEILVEQDNMDPEEAMEWYQFNMVGSYVGDNTPVFIDDDVLQYDD